MTHTDPTAAALLRAILLRPDEDTARLVYADWLDEHAGTNGYSPCPECKGEGRPARQYPLLCRKCGGTGLVPASDGFAERAEFIRAQVAIARIDQSETWGSDRDEYRRAEKVQRKHAARRREWSGIPCPVCGGAGEFDGVAMGSVDCAACNPVPWGPGAVHKPNFGGTGFAPVEFRRGFVERVRCRMDDVLRHSHATPTGTVYHLTDWARGILAAHPVTRWEIAGAEIEDIPGYGAFVGERESLAALIEPGPYRTPELARTALALAVGRVARRLAGLPEVTP